MATGILKNVEQLNKLTQTVQEKLKKSTKRLAIDELNILSASGSTSSSSSNAEKKANQTVKRLEEINDRILILLLEQEESWNRLADMAAAAFSEMATRIFGTWKGLLDVLNQQWQAASGFVQQVWQGLLEGSLKPIWQAIGEMLTSLWNEHFWPLYQRFGELMNTIGNMLGAIWNNAIWPFLQNLSNVFSPLVGIVLKGIGDGFYNLAATIADFANGGILVLQGICDFLSGVFTGRWQSAWNGVMEIFSGTWQSISSLGKGVLNGLIGLLNVFLQGFSYGFNSAVNAINRIRLTIPKWVPVVGGNSIGFQLPNIPTPQIPMLANGGVIRQPTLAMLGEYGGAGSDPEIAAPQSLLRKTMAQELNQMVPLLQSMVALLQEQNQLQQQNQPIVVLDGEQIYRSGEKYRMTQGYPIGLNPAFR